MDNKAQIIVELKDFVTKAAKKMSDAFGSLTDKVKEGVDQMDKYNQICTRLKVPDLKAKLDIVGKFSDAVKAATDGGIDFGQAMADLSSITGITGKDLDSLSKKAREFGRQSGLGANTAARAFTVIASQLEVDGIGMEGLNEIERQSIVLAQAAGISIDEAAASIAGTVNQFSLSAQEAERVVNVLAAGSKYGAAEIGDLAESFKVVGSTASSLGLNMEQTTGALEALAKNAVTGSEAGTALRNVLLSLSTKLGIDLNVTSLEDALKSLEPQLSDMAFLAEIFGRANVSAAISLIQNASAVGELTEKVTGTSTAEEQAAVRTDTAAQKIAQANAKIDDMKIALTNAVGGLTVYASVISDNVVQVAAFVQMTQMLAAKALPALISGVGKAAAFIKSLSAATVVQNAVTGKLAVTSKAFAAVQKLVNAVLTTNPIGLVIAAVAALAAGVIYAYNHFEGFRKVCDKVWGAVKDLASAVWDTLVAAFKKVAGAVKDAWDWLTRLLGLGGRKAKVEVEVDAVYASDGGELEPSVAAAYGNGDDGGESSTDADKKRLQAVGEARAAYAGLAKDLSDIAAVDEAVGKGEEAIADQISHIESLIGQLIPVLGAESEEVRGLTAKYEELKRARSAAIREKEAAKGWISAVAPPAGLTATVPVEVKPIVRTDAAAEEVARVEAMMSRLSEVQGQLDLPGLSDDTRRKLSRQADALREYLGVSEGAGKSLRKGWSSVKGIGESVTSLTDALEGNGTAWEKMCAAVDGLTAIFDGVKSAIAVLQGLTKATEGAAAASSAKGVADTTAAAQSASAAAVTVASDSAVAAAEKAKATAAVAAASGETFSAHAAIPFAGIGIAAALVATMIAVMASLPTFADGGIAYGPTLGLFGEYQGASSNPEVIAPLDRLHSLLGDAAGADAGRVEFRIKGRNLAGVLAREGGMKRRM